MNSKISQVQTTSKLPGYLFLLSNITNINDEILLSCPEEDYEFANSMLNEIGIQAQPFSGKFAEDIVLFILDSVQQLKNINPAQYQQLCNIIFIKTETLNEDSEEKIKLFLVQYPQYIIIFNTILTVSNKCFCIYFNNANKYYEKFKNIH